MSPPSPTALRRGRTATGSVEAIAFTDTHIRFVRRKIDEAVAEWTEFDAAYKTTDWGPYRGIPAFGASNRGNAYRVFLEIEAET